MRTTCLAGGDANFGHLVKVVPTVSNFFFPFHTLYIRSESWNQSTLRGIGVKLCLLEEGVSKTLEIYFKATTIINTNLKGDILRLCKYPVST